MDELRTNGITRLGLLVDQSSGAPQPAPAKKR
jgi:biopolymer transport protein TolR